MFEGFAGFAGFWTPIETGRALRREPISRWLANERVALFRKPGGEPVALIDRCPHRGAPLPSDEVSVPTDRATLTFRRWYLRECKQEPTSDRRHLSIVSGGAS